MTNMIDISEFQVSEPDTRKRMSSESNEDNLEQIRQHALGVMNALSQGIDTHPEYAG